MDKRDQLARRMLESKESLSVRRNSPAIELTPLENLLGRVQVRWPYPEMGDMEYQDWLETLEQQPLESVAAALDRLMRCPPKRELPDGSIQEYTGRPNLVDVLRMIERMADERAQEAHRQSNEEHMREMRELRRRKDAGEQFFGIADVLNAANVTEAKQAVKPMPDVRKAFPDIDSEPNRKKLEQQKKELLGS